MSIISLSMPKSWPLRQHDATDAVPRPAGGGSSNLHRWTLAWRAFTQFYIFPRKLFERICFHWDVVKDGVACNISDFCLHVLMDGRARLVIISMLVFMKFSMNRIDYSLKFACCRKGLKLQVNSNRFFSGVKTLSILLQSTTAHWCNWTGTWDYCMLLLQLVTRF